MLRSSLNWIQLFDLVKTPNGAYGIVEEVSLNGGDLSACIESVDSLNEDGPHIEKSAWWDADDGLVIVGNLAIPFARITGEEIEMIDYDD